MLRGIGAVSGKCHTWNSVMGSFLRAATVWALGGLWDAAGTPREPREPRELVLEWSPGADPSLDVAHMPLTLLPAAGTGGRIPREDPTGGSHRRIPWDSSPSSGFSTPWRSPNFQCSRICLWLLLCATPAAPVGSLEGAGTRKSRRGDAHGWRDQLLPQEDPMGFQPWSSPDFQCSRICLSLASPLCHPGSSCGTLGRTGTIKSRRGDARGWREQLLPPGGRVQGCC